MKKHHHLLHQGNRICVTVRTISSSRLFHLRMVHFVVANNVEEINNEINRKRENV